MESRDAPVDQDAAWVAIQTRAQLPEVRRFCANVERLFRINPYLEIRRWSEPHAQTYRVELRNLSNGQVENFRMSASRPDENALLFVYADRLKRSTCIALEGCGHGTCVRITDDYSGSPESERVQRNAEVDRSLTAWGVALRAYLERERHFGRFALWHAWLDRVWLPMTPAARRIAWILIWIAAAEVALTVVIVIALWLESRFAL